uniref:Kinesin motor domain-containing protein n=1 Tax=Strigamia maritima TaxID=126957 RepID=T1JB31_STRMM
MVQSTVGAGACKEPANSFNCARHKTSSIRVPTPMPQKDSQQPIESNYHRRMSSLKKSKLPLRNGTAPPTLHMTGQAHQFLEANVKAWMFPNAQSYQDSNKIIPGQIIHPTLHELNKTYQTAVPVNSIENMYGINPSTLFESSTHPQLQASAAASFFARAAQKFNLDPSKKKDDINKKISIMDDNKTHFNLSLISLTFFGYLPLLLHLVKVMLRVTPLASQADCNSSFLMLDSRKKQVTAYDPSTCGLSTPEDRRVGVAAPKMFAFDAIFSQDDSQAEVCSNSLTEVIQAVISGKDGCVFSYGGNKLGKTYTMIGNSESVQDLGIIPCAISWLFKLINEEKQKSGARFSVRVSAVEITEKSEELRDLLAHLATDSEHNGMSPGIYLKDDPIFETQLQNQSELRAPTMEKAALYLDAAIAARNECEEEENSHFLYTLHVYQYRIDKSKAERSVVSGGRSRLHLLDLGASDKPSNGLSLSAITNVILALFNGQKHIPFRNCRLTRVLCEVLGSVTCRAAMIAHVSPSLSSYNDSLNTIQFASRIHRLRRRKAKHFGFLFNDNDDKKENGIKSSSDPDCTSSSEQSCDTVIYMGSNGLSLSDKDITDNEGPPSATSKISLLPTVPEILKFKPQIRDEVKKRDVKLAIQQPKVVSESRLQLAKITSLQSESVNDDVSLNDYRGKSATPAFNFCQFATSDECWIDGPRFSKSKLEARLLPQTEMWVDGPHMYGFMDAHKREMIQRWVELQATHIQNNCQDVLCNVDEILKRCESGDDEESSIHSSKVLLDATQTETRTSADLQMEDGNSSICCSETCLRMASNSDRMMFELETRITRTVSFSNLNHECGAAITPALTRDSCLQVTEDDIYLACRNAIEEHPLRILSEENLASSFTDSLSLGGVASDIDEEIEVNYDDSDAMAFALDNLSRFQIPSDASYVSSLRLGCCISESYVNDGSSLALSQCCSECNCSSVQSAGSKQERRPQSKIPVSIKTAVKKNINSTVELQPNSNEKLELKNDLNAQVSGENSSGYESMVRDSEGSGSSFSTPELTSDTSEDEEHRKCLKLQQANNTFELETYSQEDIERIERRRMLEEQWEMRHKQQEMLRLRSKQQELRRELAMAKNRLMLNPDRWSYDLHVEESMNESDPCFLEVLERETQILEKRVIACKSRIMVVTCFDSSVVDSTQD